LTKSVKVAAVIDASVVAKWFNNEELTYKALIVKEGVVAGSWLLHGPIHLLYEVGNSIWKNRALSAGDCIKAIEALSNMNIELAAPSIDYSSRTMRLARDLGITYYDALYIQLSIDLDIILLSADQKLLSKAKTKTEVLNLKDI